MNCTLECGWMISGLSQKLIAWYPLKDEGRFYSPPKIFVLNFALSAHITLKPLLSVNGMVKTILSSPSTCAPYSSRKISRGHSKHAVPGRTESSSLRLPPLGACAVRASAPL